MKKLFVLTTVVYGLLTMNLRAQQVTQWSQFYFNDFYLNPAVAGVKDYTHINLGVRRQWLGIKEAPIAQVLTAHGYLGKNLGVGGGIINEIAGPTRRTGINLSAAYHLRLSKRTFGNRNNGKTFSFGLAAVLNQHALDNSKLTTYTPDDITIQRGYNNRVLPDIQAGIYFSNGNKYYAGFSVFNIVQSKADLYDNITKVNNSLKRHYFVTGGYNWQVNTDFAMQPSVVFQIIEATPFQFDINYRFIFKERYAIGLGYRHLDAVTGHASYQWNFLRIGYSYDYCINDIRTFTSGSHELSLGFLFYNQHAFGKKKTKKGNRSNRTNEFNPQIIDF
jgi:type IX secretion system PorP/SprF family membrane protein